MPYPYPSVAGAPARPGRRGGCSDLCFAVAGAPCGSHTVRFTLFHGG